MRPALLLTFDVEEFDLPRERGRPLARATECTVTRRGVETLLPLLAQHRVRATFFVTARFAAAAAPCVRAIAAAGHEVAAHGFCHADDYATMPPLTAVARLRRCRALLEQIAASPARGIRAPRLRPPSTKLLAEAGFDYDASAHPTWMPGRYNDLRLPRRVFHDGHLVRVPISVLPGVRWPISWLWFRTLGSPLNLLAAWSATRFANYLQLYFHPWEAMDIHPFVPRWLAVRSGAPFVAAVDRLLAWAQPRFVARTVGEVVADFDARFRSS